MDVREGMAPSGISSGAGGAGGVSGGISGGVSTPPGYRSLPKSSLSVQSNVGGSSTAMISAYQVENPSPNFTHGIDSSGDSVKRKSFTHGIGSMSAPFGDSVKRKRGRPRKYIPEGANMSLALSPMSSTLSPCSITPTSTKKKGRPPGSGWRQRLAPLGEWMNKTAGLAFTPHVIHVGIGEDVAAMVFSFAQQRPRALCILSANGSVSTVTMRQPTANGGTLTYEDRFEILCLSGSYLVAETGGRNRIGGLSISMCNPNGQIIGGAIDGRLIAASPVQVVACSFMYGAGSKPATSKTDASEKDDKSLVPKHDDQQATSAAPISATTSSWPPQVRHPDNHPRTPQTDRRNQLTEFDLSRG